MGRRKDTQNPQLDLKLNLSPPRETGQVSSPEASPPRSSVTSEENLRYSSSPEATSMVLAGCQRCLMYIMLAESDPRCPRCKSTALLEFLQEDVNKKSPI
ncbi:hypothetical protein Nepgr_000265 [Nepenthes gracilis]|uniref:GIR1-like zinc ribbon domain-containing protein n=1 Tax=Nepenthes gracilis TaxID=150966 RepID=A0AAD3P2Y6_NEPGR|nr:hypothetical protein Nepgr_000265 [Nepenthes gracilis]